MEISISIQQEFGKSEDVDCFLDEFIEKIESLNMMCGGGSDIHTGVHNFVISFVDETECENEAIVKEKTRNLQQWVLRHHFNPVILLWKSLSGEPDDSC